MPRNEPLSLLLCDMIASGRRDVARALLLEPDIDVNVVTGEGLTPLLLAAETRQPHLVALILALGADPNATDRFGRTALMRSARHDDTRSLTWLLHEGANLDLATRKQRWTALMWAARYDAANACKLLLSAGANALLHDREQRTAFQIAYCNGSSAAKATLELIEPPLPQRP